MKTPLTALLLSATLSCGAEVSGQSADSLSLRSGATPSPRDEVAAADTALPPNGVLTLEMCHAMARERNHEIKAAREQTELAENTRKSYRANYLPTITGNVMGLLSTMKGDVEVNPGDLAGQLLGGGGSGGGAAEGGASGLTQLQNIMQLLQSDAGANLVQQLLSQPGGLKQIMGMLPSQEALQGAVAEMAGSMIGNMLGGMAPIGVDYKLGPALLAGVSLQQPLFMGGKIRHATNVAGKSVEMARQNERLTQANVIEATDQAYALVILAKEMQKVAKKYNDVLLKLMSNVVKAKEQGMNTGNDVLKVQVKLNESELKLQQAENAIVLAKMNLCHNVGLRLDSDIDVSEGYPACEVREGSVSSRPEASVLATKVAIAEEKSKIERSALLPEVGAMVSYSYLNALDINGDKFFDGADLFALLSVKVPIFNCGKSTNKVRAAKNAAVMARLEQENLTEKMTLEQQRARNVLKEADKELVVARRSLDQAADNMRSSKSLYDNGLETVSDYMEAQLLWQQAMAAAVNAEYQLYLAKITLNRTSGTLVE